MQTYSADLNAMRPLADHELDAVSGGFVYIAVVVGSFLAGTGIRMGLDKIAEGIAEPQGTLKGIKPRGGK
ncbi:hypothetical protein JQ634_23425 [Bradyrhizobium sp. AUGA SZCCT0240]|uniref:hypothetical protein n=1 Tax=unclassified Bradyrhizobium TaxID=2631580 RepID=UPI001BA5B6A3|nr:MULTISPECIES: hypothetical protein [unclassified Bradyrhizobium]MBR1193750.1 hypothetical protein [Bradyrhizobium sp. AUGA SZCCT0160]MBR1200225.1 hypothetical protein [Bradyrhizobium sp. AUGA SZCCT0158]MBR1244457.1 hypothetical protein [Bradyrhizobium sp. AUGA SZCCT0274]MBR1256648.1 hypothetical protein [Bradyrhizobium sp. AUGA SZCCT0240]